MKEQKVCILGSDLGGLALASSLKKRFGDLVKITILEARSWVGGIIRTTENGDFGPMFLHKSRHVQLTALMRWWVSGVDHFESDYFIGDDEALFPEDATYVASSGETRYFGVGGVEFDAAVVDAEMAIFKKEYVPSLCSAYSLGLFDEFNLTEEQAALGEMSAADWFAGKRLPGKGDSMPKFSAATLESLKLMMGHDNGVPLEAQNLLALLLMLSSHGMGYYSGTTYVVRGGGSTVVNHGYEWLKNQGVEFRLNTHAHLKDENDPTVYFDDGTSEAFDWVVEARNPSVHDACLFDPDFQMGKSLFWNIKLKPEFAKTIATWDTYGPEGETWQSFLDRNTLVFFAGGSAYAEAADGPSMVALERAFPGITGNIVSADTIDWVKHPQSKGSFSFPAPGKRGCVTRALRRALNARVVIANEAISDEAGYPGAAVRVALWVAEQIAQRMHYGA